MEIRGVIPARVFGTLNYYYGNSEGFYSGTWSFHTELEGGVATGNQEGEEGWRTIARGGGV